MPAQILVDKHHLRILSMEPTGIPPNNSHQQLMFSGDEGDTSDTAIPSLVTSNSHLNSKGRRGDSSVIRGLTAREWLTVVVLCFVNLINYMDRFTIAGILGDIQTHFNIGDDKGGLLQTAFVLSYMVFAPLFGYLGDRYSRRAIMAFGVFLWSLTTLLGSFMDTYGGFLAFRALVGIGEASYSTIAPTIISDLFVKNLRSKMLALFYFAIPVGSGLGYIIGSETARMAGSWQWGLRVTPVMGAIAVILIIFVMQDPERGKSEGMSHLSHTSWSSDIKNLCKNPSFMLSTLGFTCVAFVAGALAWWGPTFIHSGLVLQPGNENVKINEVSLVFGAITMVSGVIGVPLGALLTQALRSRYARVDPLLCSCGLLISAPLTAAGLWLAGYNYYISLGFFFFAEIAMNLTWAIVADILLYVVIPTRRSTAEAFQILISHAFGDAGSPYLVGLISEALKAVLKPSTSENALFSTQNATLVPPENPEVKFYSLQYALFTTSFVEVIGGLFFLFTALYIVKDKLRCERAIASGETDEPTNMFADDAHLTNDQHVT